MKIDVEKLNFNSDGLVPVVVQDVASGAVLMLGYADREAVSRTLETGEAHFWSRSRRALWRKGETSGNTLKVVEVVADCDADALLVRALPQGPTCHRGTRSCFEPNVAALDLGWLEAVVASRRESPTASSYTARLLAAGVERIARKVGEEATEVVIAALGGGRNEVGEGTELAAESADLLYHLLVLWQARGLAAERVAADLARRHFAANAEPRRVKPEEQA